MGIFSGLESTIVNSISGAIKEVGDTVKQFVTTDKDRIELEKQLKEIENRYQTKIQQEVSKRHKYDMESDSWLSKNIRPIGLAFSLLASFLLLYLHSFESVPVQADAETIDFIKYICFGFIGFYTGSRGYEKAKKIMQGNKQ